MVYCLMSMYLPTRHHIYIPYRYLGTYCLPTTYYFFWVLLDVPAPGIDQSRCQDPRFGYQHRYQPLHAVNFYDPIQRTLCYK